MTVFRKSISWSKFSLALKCPLSLQKTIDKEFSVLRGPSSPSAALGKLVQKVFELYFNNDFNLKEGGQDPKVLIRVLDRTLVSKWAEKEGVDPEQRPDALEQVLKGLEIFREQKLLGHRIRSEVEMKVVFDGFRMFGMLDFLMETMNGAYLYDGKGNVSKNADPNQILYYGLMLHAARKKLIDGGFIYWRHGFERVPLDAKSLYDFVHGDFARGRKVFDLLKEGVNELEATPSNSSCYWCLWRKTCAHSVCKKDPSEVFEGIQEVGL